MNWIEKDHAISNRMNVSEQPGLYRSLAILITRSGDAPYLLLILGLTIAFAPPFWKRWALFLVLVDLVNLLITLTLKAIFKRARPPGEWGEGYRKTDPHSFPSGHSSRGGAIGMAAIVLGPLGLGIPMLFWGSLIALSRVWMGVHYLSDAIAGFILGMVIGGGFILLFG